MAKSLHEADEQRCRKDDYVEPKKLRLRLAIGFRPVPHVNMSSVQADRYITGHRESHYPVTVGHEAVLQRGLRIWSSMIMPAMAASFPWPRCRPSEKTLLAKEGRQAAIRTAEKQHRRNAMTQPNTAAIAHPISPKALSKIEAHAGKVKNTTNTQAMNHRDRL